MMLRLFNHSIPMCPIADMRWDKYQESPEMQRRYSAK